MELVTSPFNSSGKTELLQSGLVTNEQKKNP